MCILTQIRKELVDLPLEVDRSKPTRSPAQREEVCDGCVDKTSSSRSQLNVE